MTITQAWYDSLSLLKPKNGQLFLLVTLKSIIEAYKVLAVYWSWLFIGIVLCYVLPYYSNPGLYNVCFFISSLAYQLLIVGAVLSTRSSLMPKTCAYFRANIGYGLLPVCIMFLLFINNRSYSGMLSVYIFTLLFLFDSRKNIGSLIPVLGYSCINAIKMVIYNLPLLTVVNFIFFGLENIWCAVEWRQEHYLLCNVISAFFLPIVICTYTNIYIKKLHDQFSIYCKMPN